MLIKLDKRAAISIRYTHQKGKSAELNWIKKMNKQLNGKMIYSIIRIHILLFTYGAKRMKTKWVDQAGWAFFKVSMSFR